jgi:hypothetical protein
VARHIVIELERRGVRCRARLLDDDAPRTCAAVWGALPLAGDVFHAKYARNEIYTFVPPFAADEPGLENPTITPIPGDVCYFAFSAGQLPARTYGYGPGPGAGAAGAETVVDLALFYGRNNLLLNADVGFVPGNVFATVVEGLEEMAVAANDVWRAGAIGETLSFRREDGGR